MPARNEAVLDFLLTRRSRPVKTLTGPGPGRAEIELLLTAAARSPDHGKLEPWRFVVLTGPALRRLAEAVPARGAALGLETERIDKMVAQLGTPGIAIAVIAAPKETAKVPAIEQVLSAGAVCLGLLNAALAAGWGAAWLTGWAMHDRTFAVEHLGLGSGEFVAGLVHIGTETAPPPERPRPDLSRITTWPEA